MEILNKFLNSDLKLGNFCKIYKVNKDRLEQLLKDNNYYLSDYAGNNLLNMYFDKVYFYKEILLLINNNTLYIYDSSNEKLLSSTIKVNRPEDINVEKSDDYFDISIGGIKNTRVYYEGRIESLNNSNENDNNTNQDAIDDNTNTFDNAS